MTEPFIDYDLINEERKINEFNCDNVKDYQEDLLIEQAQDGADR